MLCSTCGKEFEGRSDARYCSAKCRVYAKRNKPVTDNVTDKLSVTEVVTDNVPKAVFDGMVDSYEKRIKVLEGEVSMLRKDLTAKAEKKAVRENSGDLAKIVIAERMEKLGCGRTF